MLYTISNSFHNTKVRTKYDSEKRYHISVNVFDGTATSAEKQAMRRAWKVLCGIKECSCCDEWGIR